MFSTTTAGDCQDLRHGGDGGQLKMQPEMHLTVFSPMLIYSVLLHLSLIDTLPINIYVQLSSLLATSVIECLSMCFTKVYFPKLLKSVLFQKCVFQVLLQALFQKRFFRKLIF